MDYACYFGTVGCSGGETCKCTNKGEGGERSRDGADASDPATRGGEYQSAGECLRSKEGSLSRGKVGVACANGTNDDDLESGKGKSGLHTHFNAAGQEHKGSEDSASAAQKQLVDSVKEDRGLNVQKEDATKRPYTLIIVDGTWNQARRIGLRIPENIKRVRASYAHVIICIPCSSGGGDLFGRMYRISFILCAGTSQIRVLDL